MWPHKDTGRDLSADLYNRSLELAPEPAKESVAAFAMALRMQGTHLWEHMMTYHLDFYNWRPQCEFTACPYHGTYVTQFMHLEPKQAIRAMLAEAWRLRNDRPEQEREQSLHNTSNSEHAGGVR